MTVDALALVQIRGGQIALFFVKSNIYQISKLDNISNQIVIKYVMAKIHSNQILLKQGRAKKTLNQILLKY